MAKISKTNKKKLQFAKDISIIGIIVFLVFLIQLFMRGTSIEVGFPFRFISAEVTGNVPAPMLGEIYSSKVLWSGMVLDTIIYIATTYLVIHLVRKTKRTR